MRTWMKILWIATLKYSVLQALIFINTHALVQNKTFKVKVKLDCCFLYCLPWSDLKRCVTRLWAFFKPQNRAQGKCLSLIYIMLNGYSLINSTSNFLSWFELAPYFISVNSRDSQRSQKCESQPFETTLHSLASKSELGDQIVPTDCKLCCLDCSVGLIWAYSFNWVKKKKRQDSLILPLSLSVSLKEPLLFSQSIYLSI